MTKSLLLKGLAGVAALGGAGAGLFVFREEIFGAGGNKPGKAAEINSEEVDEFSQKELIDKAGLSCGLNDGEEVTDTPKDCSVKDNGTINVKRGEEEKEEGVTFTSNGSKLKVSGDEGYPKNLKFVVDSGDLQLTKGGSAATTIQKLEQFETYEIKEEGGKFYLSRRTDSKVGIKNALGLGEFSLPVEGEANRSFSDAEQIKKIRFEGQEGGITVSDGNSVSLKVSSTVDTTTFPYGYRFTFTFPQDQTINSTTFKAKIPYEFKIKKGTGNTLTLEKVWESDNAFTKKAGLDCTNNTQCSVSSDSQKLNVKVGHQKKVDISSLNGSGGKIKMEKEQEGYNQGLKFTIADGNVTFTGGTGDVEKLEELETYEITEDGGKYYLTKKTSPDELIRNSLGIKDVCELPTTDASVECTLDEAKFKKINFDGKSDTASGSGTLTISKANSTDFPFGYKFTFKTEKETTIKTDTKITAKIPTDFKIKKGTGTGTGVSLSLEKAWDDAKYSLATKVGLTCTTESEGCCTKTDGGSQVKLNVKRGSDIKEGIDSVSTSGTQKIKVEKDKEGYNQGLKFTITGGDVTLTGGNKVGNSTDFTSLEEFETYEITEDKGKYYLTRKTSKEDVLKSSLSIPQECFKTLGTSCTLTQDAFKAINFEGKSSPTSTGTVSLTVSKGANTTDFPMGYKFTFNTTADATIKKDTTTIKANIPTDFKIKKNDSNPTTLTLEKAWTPATLGAKVGLDCKGSSGTECCSMTSGGKLNVKQDYDKKHDITGITGSGKIKVEKDQAGYKHGLKFSITEGDVTLTGGTLTSGSSSFSKLGEYETYEIEEEGDKWYLSRKHEAIVFLKEQLGFEFCSDDTIGSIFTCEIKKVEDLKKIKFENMSSFASWPKGPLGIQLSVERDTKSSDGGLKFTISKDDNQKVNNSESSWNIPNGAGGSIDLKSSSSTGGAEYKIKKGSGGTLTLEKKS